MTTWVFTFGDGQRLRSTPRQPQPGDYDAARRANVALPYTAGGIGLPLHNRYVVIPGEDYADCRAKMLAIFGAVWAFDYPYVQAAGVGEFGLVELDVSEALIELARDGWSAVAS